MKMTSGEFAPISNGYYIPLIEIPSSSFFDFTETILANVRSGQRVSAFFGAKTKKADTTALYAILADDEHNQLYVGKTEITGESFPSLTPLCPQVHLFEREIAEQFGLTPLGHPWLKRVRYCPSWTGKDVWGRKDSAPLLPAVGAFYRVMGAQLHEVSVGPVHAGIIEPGYFRFQCHGEHILHLEIALGFQHRGIEESLIGPLNAKTIHYIETASGDSTVGHTTSYCQIIEALSHTQKPARAQVLRGIALELERIANQVGTLGALSGDVGFLPTASFCGRIRGDFLNLSALMCGNRFSRGLVIPGGVRFDIDQKIVAEMLQRLVALKKETGESINLLWDNQSVMARFETTGILTKEQAIALGIVGPASRASGLSRDARYNQPSGIYRFAQIPISTAESGDVYARAYVLWMEIQQSIDFIIDQLNALPQGAIIASSGILKKNCLSVAINEGWRGEIAHVAITDDSGFFSRYKIVDPSFHNWQALTQVVRNHEISDFPLCNKSFNLSYCGHDL